MSRTLTKLSGALVSAYDQDYSQHHDQTISVNPLVAELATWYEKLRTAMDYRDDEVILRSAIERILKRRLLLGGNGQTIAAPLLRELVWARYFPDSSIPESTVAKVAHAIDLFLKFEEEINKKHRVNKGMVNEWILHLLSSEIEYILKPDHHKDLMSNYIYQIFRARMQIADDSEQVKNIQTFIAVRRAYANDDLPFLRYHLFLQYFGKLTAHNLETTSSRFMEGYRNIQSQLNYPLKNKFFVYIDSQKVPFLILDDVLKKNQGSIVSLISDEDQLNLAVLSVCSQRYKSVKGRVRRAIIRSVIFIFFTKALFALFIEGTFENLLFGKIFWPSIALNTLTPPLLMILVGFFIQTPSRENSFKIQRKINSLLFDENPQLENPLVIKKKIKKTDPLIWSLFMILWLATFAVSFGALIFILTKLSVNPISQGVFIFFIAIVSFIAYRINRTANMYVVKDGKENLASLFSDFFFMPFITVGRRLTLAVSQINIILFIIDFIIEAPFKGIFAFFEQWLLFLRTQREKLD
ncbi:hypothetical protein HYZ05_01750 [Candidatus Daviesbacteria bacterium]|nr:hypothetical protein [Candidatus Daviesbacteria bacterium]